MSDEIGLFDAICSQRAIRYLRPDPVAEESIRKLIEAATKAPSGANSQPWKFIVIRDPSIKVRISEYYLCAWEAAYGSQAQRPSNIQAHVRLSADHLARNMAGVPVLILACIQHDGSPTTMNRGASIYPAVQNLLLAARALGLGASSPLCISGTRRRSSRCWAYPRTWRGLPFYRWGIQKRAFSMAQRGGRRCKR